MTKILLMIVLGLGVTCTFARNSYTGGYSGAPGRQICASSCHGGTSGTLVVSGFPASYQPGQAYRIVVRRNGGSLIVNFNATTRVGSTSTIAGTFAAVTNSILYTGVDGGVYANPHAIDSAVFNWTAPSSGTGVLNFYLAGFQGTTSSSNGQSTRVILSSTESTTGIETERLLPSQLLLHQNYPNPFNPTTTIRFELPASSHVSLKIHDVRGSQVATLLNDEMKSGIFSLRFDAREFATGIYFYSLNANGITRIRKMVIAK